MEIQPKITQRDLKLFRLLSPELCELWEYLPTTEDENGEQILPDAAPAMEIVLARVAEILDRSGQIRSVKKLIDELAYRESQASTVIGRGFAIPHVRSKNTRDLVLCYLRYPEGIILQGALGLETIHHIFGMVTPIFEEDTDYQKVHRKLISMICTDDTFVTDLDEMASQGEIIRILKLRD